MPENKNIKEYTNGEITVLWDATKCRHSANCVKNLSEVFKPKEKFWVKIENSTSEKIISTVNKCPSGALSIKK